MKIERGSGAVPEGTFSMADLSPDLGPGLMNAVASRLRSGVALRLVTCVVLAALMAALGCSKETPAAASKAPVTVDPDVFSVEDPQLFKTAKAETRELPTELTANGTVTPDVNRTIHVTSLGSGRVVDLKVKLGDSVTKGQTLLVISSPDLAAAMSDYQKAVADEVLSRSEPFVLRPRFLYVVLGDVRQTRGQRRDDGLTRMHLRDADERDLGRRTARQARRAGDSFPHRRDAPRERIRSPVRRDSDLQLHGRRLFRYISTLS